MATRVLAFLVCCDACGTEARVSPDCDLYASWAVAHMLPRIVSAEVVGEIGFRALNSTVCRAPGLRCRHAESAVLTHHRGPAERG